jgi:hypothetical protein
MRTKDCRVKELPPPAEGDVVLVITHTRGIRCEEVKQVNEEGFRTTNQDLRWSSEGEFWWRCDQAGDFRFEAPWQTRESILAARARRKLDSEISAADRDRIEAEDVALAACGGSKD